MDGTQTSPADTPGTSTPTNPTEDTKPTENIQTTSPLIEAAKTENDRREKLLEEEKKLMDRKEKFHAEQIVGGRSLAGQETPKQKEETPHEYRKRIEKEMAGGRTEFGN